MATEKKGCRGAPLPQQEETLLSWLLWLCTFLGFLLLIPLLLWNLLLFFWPTLRHWCSKRPLLSHSAVSPKWSPIQSYLLMTIIHLSNKHIYWNRNKWQERERNTIQSWISETTNKRSQFLLSLIMKKKSKNKNISLEIRRYYHRYWRNEKVHENVYVQFLWWYIWNPRKNDGFLIQYNWPTLTREVENLKRPVSNTLGKWLKRYRWKRHWQQKVSQLGHA